MLSRIDRFLAVSFLLAASTMSIAANTQGAGAIDGEVILVDHASIDLAGDKEGRLISFTWVLTNLVTVKSIEGQQYDSIVETAFVNCDDPSTRGVIFREYQFRGMRDRRIDLKIVVKKEDVFADKSSNASMINTVGSYSPPRLAADYVCAFAESKKKGIVFNYQIQTTPTDTATQLICIFPASSGKDLELPVSFDEKRGLVTLGHYAHSVFSITNNQIFVEVRKAYGKPSKSSLLISRLTGKAVLNDSLKGSCTPVASKRF